MSLRDEIRSAPVASGEKVDVPEWGVTVEVRPMSVRGRAKVYTDSIVDSEMQIEKLYPALLITSVYDPATGELVFTQEDADWLVDQSSAPVERIAEVVLRLSGLDREAVEAGKVGLSTTPNTNTVSS